MTLNAKLGVFIIFQRFWAATHISRAAAFTRDGGNIVPSVSCWNQ